MILCPLNMEIKGKIKLYSAFFAIFLGVLISSCIFTFRSNDYFDKHHVSCPFSDALSSLSLHKLIS